MQLMSSATCYKSAAIHSAYETASVNIRYMSDIFCYMSDIIRYVSDIIRYMSDIALLAYCIRLLDIVITRDSYLGVT